MPPSLASVFQNVASTDYPGQKGISSTSTFDTVTQQLLPTLPTITHVPLISPTPSSLEPYPTLGSASTDVACKNTSHVQSLCLASALVVIGNTLAVAIYATLPTTPQQELASKLKTLKELKADITNLEEVSNSLGIGSNASLSSEESLQGDLSQVPSDSSCTPTVKQLRQTYATFRSAARELEHQIGDHHWTLYFRRPKIDQETKDELINLGESLRDFELSVQSSTKSHNRLVKQLNAKIVAEQLAHEQAKRAEEARNMRTGIPASFDVEVDHSDIVFWASSPIAT